MNGLFSTSLMKAFDILECFKKDSREMGISEIASRVSLPVSSVHRIIQSLEFEGLLMQNPKTRKYRLGTKILSISYKCDLFDRQVKTATEYVEQLGRVTGETASLAIGTRDSTIHIFRTKCPHALHPTFPLNVPFPSYCTAVGRIFLSEMDVSAQKWIYKKDREEIGLSEEEFLNLLRDAKANGYALDDECFSSGQRCVAAPVRMSNGKTVYAISVSAPLVRMDDKLYSRTKDIVVEYASVISSEIAKFEQ